MSSIFATVELLSGILLMSELLRMDSGATAKSAKIPGKAAGAGSSEAFAVPRNSLSALVVALNILLKLLANSPCSRRNFLGKQMFQHEKLAVIPDPF